MLNIGEVTRVRLIDGMPPEPAVLVRSGIVENWQACKHCCAHTGGPIFPCCKCGANFMADADLTFTEREGAELKPFNCAAHHWLRREKPRDRAYRWLCLGATERARARRGLLTFLQKGIQSFMRATDAELIRALENGYDEDRFESWKRAELAAKGLRLAHELSGYYADPVQP